MAQAEQISLRALVVDDEEAEGIVQDVQSVTEGKALCRIATSRDMALDLIASEEFDLVICDLRIGPNDNSADKQVAYGLEVYAHVIKEIPGASVVLLTGQGDQRPARQAVGARPTSDMFGTGKQQIMTDFIFKSEVEEYLKFVKGVHDGFTGLDGAVSLEGTELSLGAGRLIKSFARRHGATRAVLKERSGLSGVRAYATELWVNEQHLMSLFVKVGPWQKIQEEISNYEKLAPRLAATTFAPQFSPCDSGGGKNAALIYSFAEEFTTDLFGLLSADPARASDVLASVASALRGLQESRTRTIIRQGTWRAAAIDEVKLAPFRESLGSIREGWEDMEVNVQCTLQHGDLHCGNVLVSAKGDPLLVDFGSVDSLLACQDPITMELGLLFHDDSPFSELDWPSQDQCENWLDTTKLLEDCPFPSFLTRLREWRDSTVDRSEVRLATYCHALRQLRYPDVLASSIKIERVLAIARSCATDK